MTTIITAIKGMLQELDAIDKEISQLPLGSLVRRSNKTYHHHVSQKTKGITNNPEKIQKLARKKYLFERRKQLRNNMRYPKNLNFDKLDLRTPHELIAALSKTYQDLPLEYFFHPEAVIWMNAPLAPNQSYRTGDLKYESTSGKKFRSKSERDIANVLERLKIPYRYEVLQRLVGRSTPVLTDFIVTNPFTNKTFLWEHFGLNDPQYERDMNDKMTAYRRSGYIQNETIIYTFESDVEAADRIEEIIKNFVLA